MHQLEGDYQSTDRNLCPKYVQQAKVLKKAYQENVPFPIAAMELVKLTKEPSFSKINEAKK